MDLGGQMGYMGYGIHIYVFKLFLTYNIFSTVAQNWHTKTLESALRDFFH